MPSIRTALALTATGTALVTALAPSAGAAGPTRPVVSGHVSASSVTGGLPVGATLSVLQFCPPGTALDRATTATAARAVDGTLDRHVRLASRELWPTGTVSRYRVTRAVPARSEVPLLNAAVCTGRAPAGATTVRGSAVTDLRVWGPAPSDLTVVNGTIAVVTDEVDAEDTFVTVMRAGGVASSRGSLRGAVTAVQTAITESGLSAIVAVGQTSRRIPRGSFVSMENSYRYVADLTRRTTVATDAQQG